MDCRKFQKNLEDYLEGGLDFPGRFGMERHARQCFGCERELAYAQKLSQMAREIKRVSAPAGFEAGVLSRIHARGPRSRFWSLRRFWIYGFDYPSWRLVALGTSALALLGFGVFFALFWVGRDHKSPASWVSNTPTSVSSSLQNTGFVSAPSSLEPSARPESAETRNSGPVTLDSPRVRSRSSTEDDGFAGQTEPSEYEECLVPGPGDRQMIVRLPKTILMRYAQPSEEYYIRNVSH
jgi:hypothetical protein